MQKIGDIFKGDRVIWIIYFFLCIISLIEGFSASSWLALKSGSYVMPFIKHGALLFAGFGITFIIHRISCRYFRLVPVIGVPVIILMLLLVLLIGASLNSGARWMEMGGLSIQPSEFAKGILVSAVALILTIFQTEDGTEDIAFKAIIVVTGIICVLVMFENLSTAVLMGFVVLCMMFIGRISLKRIGALLGVIFLFGASALFVISLIPSDSKVFQQGAPLHRFSTWKNRIVNFGDSEDEKPAELLVASDLGQEEHAAIAIATSHGVGKMPGNSDQREYLAHAYSDFIYAIIIEETGLAGGLIVMVLYIILLYRAAMIARRCKGCFPAFLVLGLTILMVTQAFINMTVAVGGMPITGQTLPLVSRGGSSIICCSVWFGMILSVSAYAQRCEMKEKMEAENIKTKQFDNNEEVQ